jgi:hypothetical protein
LQQRTAPAYDYDDIVHDVKQKLQTGHEVARENLMQSKQRGVLSKYGKFNMPPFENGDKVLLQNEKAGKLNSPGWGPIRFVK